MSARIVDSASARIRERGIESIKVAELMKSAGLTHGGFYFHFKSRTDLIDKAFARAMEGSVDQWQRLAEMAGPGERLQSIVDYYLAEQHRKDVAHGCALPALSAEVSRSSTSIRRRFSAGLEEMIQVLSEDMRGSSKKAAQRQAIAILSEMVGALLLARAVDRADFSAEILSVAREAVLGTTPRGQRNSQGTTKSAAEHRASGCERCSET
jgi:TetR/AcrR family transcriptional repressor of nem operon